MKQIKNHIKYILYNSQLLGKLFLISLFLFLVIVTILRLGSFNYEFQKGKPWAYNDLIAPFNFPIYKSADELKKQKEDIEINSHVWYIIDTNLPEQQKQKALTAIENFYNNNKSYEGEKSVVTKYVSSLFDSIYKKGIILAYIPKDKKIKPSNDLFLVKGNTAIKSNIEIFYTINTANNMIVSSITKHTFLNNNEIYKIVIDNLKQNITYDKLSTEKYLQSHFSSIPTTKGVVQAGERVISKGELVNSEKEQILKSLQEEIHLKKGYSIKYFNIILGNIIIVFLITTVFLFFIISNRKDIKNDNKKLLLLLLSVYLMIFVASITINYKNDYIYALPFCLIPIIIRVFFDSKLAILVHIFTLLLISLAVSFRFELLINQIIAGFVTLITLVELRKRLQLIATAFAVFATYLITYFGFLLILDGTIHNIDANFIIMFAVSAFLILLSTPIIFIFEKLFGMVTDITLMELADTNGFILRRLSLLAPGTFQHSMQVANLAEAAIYEIGGNPLLVRVGALYHDIGKMDMPMYFIENQNSEINPHDDLSSEDSAKIIISHIANGINIAYKRKLPEQIIDFIRTHHGTGVTAYFYNKFKSENPNEIVDETIFTYPGPKPFSKETSVLMMADSVEAASRSLKKPTIESIAKLVDNVIDNHVKNEQFANSELTLKDILTVRKTLKNKLMSIYHVRIAYPEI